MGRHKKFLKAEKARIKLKDTKLKGPQNVTKTDFKVKKIVITEQLKNVQVKETGVRKVHSITDCLARLRNSSSTEVISNLKEIILYQQEDFRKHLEQIIKIVANLSLSIEKVDRKECFKILDMICAHTSEQNLQPFFPILVKFLKCAMTHIKPAIQEDSLMMLDVLLKNAPQLVATEKDNILPPYLDMVSKMRIEDKPERTLSLQLGNKITSLRWRKSVLERLIVFLKCIGTQEKQVDKVDSTGCAREIIVKPNMLYLGSLYDPSTVNAYFNNHIPLASIERHLKATTAQPIASELKITKYSEMIMPLMFETWMELKPKESKTIDGRSCAQVSHEAALMLRIVMDVTMELFQMVEETNEATKLKFLKKNQEKFDLHLVSSFPYTQEDSSLKSPESGGGKCLYQNITIAFLFLNFTALNRQRFWKYREKIFNFLDDCIVNWKPKDPEMGRLVKKIIRLLFTKEMQSIFVQESKQIFTQLIRQCKVDQTTYDPKLALVCEIIETTKKDSIYAEIVPQMIQVLSQRETIPAHVIRTVSVLAKQGNQIAFDHLEQNMVGIVKNLLGSMKMTGKLVDDGERWKNDVANLVYWVRDDGVLKDVADELKDDRVSRYIRDIINLKIK